MNKKNKKLRYFVANLLGKSKDEIVEDDLLNIKELVIDPLDDEGYVSFDINFLKHFKNLEKISLKNMPISNNLLMVLANMYSLRKVHFFNTSINTLMPFEKSYVYEIHLISSYLFDIDSLKNCKRLNIIELKDMGSIDIGFLQTLPNVLKLYLSYTKIERASVFSIFNLLEEIAIDNTEIEDISFLDGFNNLKKVNLDFNQFKNNKRLVKELQEKRVQVLVSGFPFLGDINEV